MNNEIIQKYTKQILFAVNPDDGQDMKMLSKIIDNIYQEGREKSLELTEKARNSLDTLLNYLIENEQNHYVENDRPAGHIFMHALRVKKWLVDRKTKNKKITIPFSESDLQDLINGQEFDWTFNNIDVHIRPEKQSDL